MRKGTIRLNHRSETKTAKFSLVASAKVLPNGVSGYADVPLTAKGEDEARAAGRALQRDGFEFDMVFCSLLKR